MPAGVSVVPCGGARPTQATGGHWGNEVSERDGCLIPAWSVAAPLASRRVAPRCRGGTRGIDKKIWKVVLQVFLGSVLDMDGWKREYLLSSSSLDVVLTVLPLGENECGGPYSLVP
jgi:hypothetical protein